MNTNIFDGQRSILPFEIGLLFDRWDKKKLNYQIVPFLVLLKQIEWEENDNWIIGLFFFLFFLLALSVDLIFMDQFLVGLWRIKENDMFISVAALIFVFEYL